PPSVELRHSVALTGRRLELGAQEACGPIRYFCAKGPLLPLAKGIGFRAQEIRFEKRDLGGREVLIVKIDIGLVVQPKGAFVDIGRADRRPNIVENDD